MTQTRVERARRQREHIAGAAHWLFLDHGYEATSYQDIATAAGIERNLVQYYFPKKDGLVLGLMDTVLRAAERAATPYFTGQSVFVELHLVAQVYFGFLLDPHVHALTLDVVSSRRMTDEIILFDETWLRERLGPVVESWSQFTDDMTMAVGGAYELCYQALAHDTALDARDLTTRLLLAFMASAGEDPTASRSLLASCRLDDGQLAAAIDAVRAACGQETPTT